MPGTGGALTEGAAPPAPTASALGPGLGGAIGTGAPTGGDGPTTGGAFRAGPGAPAKYALARRWISVARESANSSFGAPGVGSLVLMVLADIDALEDRDGVVGQHRDGAIERDEVLRGASLIDPHQPDRQARSRLPGK